MLTLQTVRCPYCGESFETNVDISDVDNSGGDQEYIEDCYVCCRPIVFAVTTDARGNTTLDVKRDND